jgi:hypothetical protein
MLAEESIPPLMIDGRWTKMESGTMKFLCRALKEDGAHWL